MHEGHLAVDLSELGLPVGTEVLIPETFHQLVIPVVAGHHQQLLEGLRRLWQGIELAGVHARGHHEVARPLGCRLDQVGGFDLEEPDAVEVIPNGNGHAVPQLQVLPERVAPLVEVTVFHPQLLAALGLVLDGERRQGRRVEDLQGLHPDLDIACRDVGLLRLPLEHRSRSRYHKFTSQRPDLFDQPFRAVLFLNQ